MWRVRALLIRSIGSSCGCALSAQHVVGAFDTVAQSLGGVFQTVPYFFVGVVDAVTDGTSALLQFMGGVVHGLFGQLHRVRRVVGHNHGEGALWLRIGQVWLGRCTYPMHHGQDILVNGCLFGALAGDTLLATQSGASLFAGGACEFRRVRKHGIVAVTRCRPGERHRVAAECALKNVPIPGDDATNPVDEVIFALCLKTVDALRSL
mmetsp:Transcript_7571/g.23317  ORF Transcript_7571/g.23317 Transcript_7571/m.23317 type:complete len:207 (+) Transcript_7571:41-661(+)